MMVPAVAEATIRSYEAPLNNSRWEMTVSTPLECRLSHPVPGYGVANFYRQSGNGPEGFYMKTFDKPDQLPTVTVRSMPPPWMHGASGKVLAQLAMAPGTMPINLNADQSYRVISELRRGLFPTFSFKDPISAQQKYQVALSTVGFRQGWRDWQSCVTSLLPYRFPQVSDSVIRFAYDSTRLNESSKDRLEQVRQYLEVDPSVVVRIEAHTDAIGVKRYNWALSRKRAQRVQNFLARNGLDAKRFVIKNYGYDRPIANNLTEKGRSENRRVYVRLKRKKNY